MNNALSAKQLLAQSWRLIGPQRRQLPMVFLASVLLSVLDTTSVGLMGPFVASIISPEIMADKLWFLWLQSAVGMSLTPVSFMAVLLLGVFLVKLLGATLVLRITFGFCSTLDRRLRRDLLEHYYAIELSQLTASSSAGFVQAVHGYTAQFAYGLVGTQLRLLTEIIIAAAILAYLFYLNAPALIFLLVLVGLLVFFYDAVVKKKIHAYGHETASLGEDLISAVQQVTSGIREIRVYGADMRLLDKAKDAADRFSTLSAKHLWIQAIPKYMIEFCLMASICVLVMLMQREQIPKEEMFALMGVFGVAVMRLTPAANYILNALSQLRFSHFVVHRLTGDLGLQDGEQPTVGSPAVRASVDRIERIELKNVSFRYSENGRQIFSNVNLALRSGDSIGLIGPSGGGKTTLAELILGLWQPVEGELSINDVAATEFDPTSVRSHFAYIPQQLFMIDGTLAENISLLDPSPDSRARVETAAAAAQLKSHVASLPLGLDTPCGENGAQLSGGQRQRVALARAFYHHRSILVMDEATSALDYETEREIIQEIRSLKGKVTLIVIAHRLETVMDCDRIYRIADGAVTEVPRSALRRPA